MYSSTSLPLYLSSILLILILPFNISAQEYNDIWLRDWVNNQGISNTLAGRNLSIFTFYLLLIGRVLKK